MKVSRPNAKKLTTEEIQHLKQLKDLVKRALADGKLSRQEIDAINASIFADGKVTLEELTLIKDTVHENLGEAELEYDWW